MHKKNALIPLLLIAFFCMATVANAAIRASEYIGSYFADPQRSPENKVTISFDIICTDAMDVLGAKTIIIQEKASGSTQWNAVATMTSDEYPGMLRYNASRHSSYVSYSDAKSGYYYRAKVYFYAEKGGYDTREFITPAV